MGVGARTLLGFFVQEPLQGQVLWRMPRSCTFNMNTMLNSEPESLHDCIGGLSVLCKNRSSCGRLVYACHCSFVESGRVSGSTKRIWLGKYHLGWLIKGVCV